MSSNLNVAVISGNLTRDPEIRQANSGMTVMNFSVACNEWKKNGDDWVNYIDCVAFDKKAESLGRILRKGDHVSVKGRLHQDRWEKDGKTASRVVITVEDVELDRRPKGSETPSEIIEVEASVYEEEIPF